MANHKKGVSIDENYRIQLRWERAETEKERAYWQRRMDQKDREKRIRMKIGWYSLLPAVILIVGSFFFPSAGQLLFSTGFVLLIVAGFVAITGAE